MNFMGLCSYVRIQHKQVDIVVELEDGIYCIEQAIEIGNSFIVLI